jgi:pSer/pThr/pTyr-binding forkhead associated (FHA) protein
MSFEIGIACGKCDTWNPLGVAACSACANDLALQRSEPQSKTRTEPKVPANRDDGHAPRPGPAATQLSEEELMEQARNYVCRECSTPVPSGHKFCGTCGAGVPPEVVELRTKYFGTMQTPGKARLILIRGDSGVDGLSYMLQGTEHIAGREEGQILFPDDTWLSRRHANFIYDNGQLVVRDEGSLNGIYVRVRESVPISFGDGFLCGEQLFFLEPPPEDTAGPSQDQTYFYSSPRKAHGFRVVQMLAGGARGLEHCATGTSVKIGREECDLNFPVDVYMSAVHARVDVSADGRIVLVDLGSKNGTYLRVQGSQPLRHGDYLFMGKQLLRVEITA